MLAGGKGLRLRSRTGALPKPLVPVCGRPLLEYHLALCRRHGFTRILLLVHHAHDAIRARLGDGSAYGVALEYQVDAGPFGTAGAVRDALARTTETFLVMYADTYLDVDLRRLWDAHASRGADATLFVHPNDHPSDSDLVEADREGWLTAVHPYPHDAGADHRNLANAGLLVLQRAILAGLVPADTPSDLIKDAVPAMLRAGRRVHVYVSPEYIKDIGTPERLDRVEADLRAGVPEQLSGRDLRAAVFLDRDGTLNREVDHLRTAGQLELVDGAAVAVRRLNGAGRLAVVVTNQPTVARGEVTPAGLERIHARFERLLGEQGAYVDAIYACPHHPDRGFAGEVPELKIPCECRKPATGLIDAACRRLLIDRRRSWLVGDTTADMETGRRAGLRTILVRTGYAGGDGRYPFRPDYVTMNLNEAVAWILEGHDRLARRLAPVAAAAIEARLVLIGGLARTGKSAAAQVLKEALAACGRTAHVLSLDSWLKPAAERAEGAGVAARFDLDRVAATLGRLLDAADRQFVEMPVYDRARRDQYEHRVAMSIGSGDLLIVEGVPALLAPGLAALPAVRVHMEMPEERRLAALRADYRWRGEPDDAVEALLVSRAGDETTPVQDGRRGADFIVTAGTDL
jgi:histidinol-phosphate phosphatase family protein